jgi:general secretion pathway protein D
MAAQPATAVAPAAAAPAPAAAPAAQPAPQQGAATQPANPAGTVPQGTGNAAPPAAQPKGAPVSLVLSLPSSVQLNSQFAVQVNANGAKDLYNAVFVVTYDASKLDVVSQAAGDLLKQNNTNINFQAFPDRKKGELWISEMRTNAPAGASGSGSLATVTFKAIARGGAPIGFSNTTLSNTSGAQMPVTAFKSVVEVK